MKLQEINKNIEQDVVQQINEQFNRLDEFVNTENRTLGELTKMMDAAKRALGLANTLKPSPRKGEYLSRIMTNLNKIRSGLNRVVKEIEAQVEQQTGQYQDEQQMNDVASPQGRSPQYESKK